MPYPMRTMRLEDDYWHALEALALRNRTEVVRTSIHLLVEVLEYAAAGLAAKSLAELVEKCKNRWKRRNCKPLPRKPKK